MAVCSNIDEKSIVSSLLAIWTNWHVTILIVVTMSFQAFLVLAGFFRKNTLHGWFHALVWVCYLGVDAAAIYALGFMLGSGCDNVFSVWAPLLLFHLGAVDAINAYSPADNELWRRCAFKMALEFVAVACILSRSAGCPKFLSTGIVLCVVGTFKYGESVYAKMSGSSAQVLISARPIYSFMSLEYSEIEGSVDELIVAGEWEWYRDYSKLSERKREDDQNESHRREKRQLVNVVTYDAIRGCRELKQAEKPDRRYIDDLCLAYALFKIYRRRLTNLRIHQKPDDYEKVRRVLFPLKERDRPSPDIIRVIELELSFIFDGVFSKGAEARCYQGIGLATRLVSMLLLSVVAFNLIAMDATHLSCKRTSSVHPAGAFGQVQVFTHFLVVVALLTECVQLYKLFRSNWIKVWLACCYIRELHLVNFTEPSPNLRFVHMLKIKAIIAILRNVGEPRGTHWKCRIDQRSIMVDCLTSVCLRHLLQFDINSLQSKMKRRKSIDNLHPVDVGKLQKYLIKKVTEKFSCVKRDNLESKRNELTRCVSRLFDILGEDHEKPTNSLESAILQWHLATSICELDLLNKKPSQRAENAAEDWEASIWLSRYCLYLMIERPKLMPEDPDLAQSLYRRLKGDEELEQICTGKSMESAGKRQQHESVSAGINWGRQLIETSKTAESKWKTLADAWVDILIYIAISENATPHTEQMAKGGELVTLLWVLLGHLGFGQNV